MLKKSKKTEEHVACCPALESWISNTAQPWLLQPVLSPQVCLSSPQPCFLLQGFPGGQLSGSCGEAQGNLYIHFTGHLTGQGIIWNDIRIFLLPFVELSHTKYTVFEGDTESPQCAGAGRQPHSRSWGKQQRQSCSQLCQVMSACGSVWLLQRNLWPSDLHVESPQTPPTSFQQWNHDSDDKS